MFRSTRTQSNTTHNKIEIHTPYCIAILFQVYTIREALAYLNKQIYTKNPSKIVIGKTQVPIKGKCISKLWYFFSLNFIFNFFQLFVFIFSSNYYLITLSNFSHSPPPASGNHYSVLYSYDFSFILFCFVFRFHI